MNAENKLTRFIYTIIMFVYVHENIRPLYKRKVLLHLRKHLTIELL